MGRTSAVAVVRKGLIPIFSLCCTAAWGADINGLEGLYKYTADSDFSGVIHVQKNEVVLASHAFGNASPGIANSTTTPFLVGSITKQFTAASIMKLQEEGLVSTNDTLCSYVPQLVHCAEITIHQLLNHTAGLANYTDDPELTKFYAMPVSPEKLISFFQAKPLDFVPGTQFHYSNSNYVVAGAVVEKVSGKDFNTFLQQNFLIPAGIDGISYDPENLPKDIAQGTTYNGEYVAQPVPAGSLSWGFAAGGLHAHAADLSKWNKALFGGKIVSKASLEKMKDPGKFNYGYGLVPVKVGFLTAYAHNGKVPGSVSSNVYFPQTGVSITVLCNNDSQDVTAVARRTAEVLMTGKTTGPDIYPIAVKADDLKAFAGNYAGGETKLSITMNGENLYLNNAGQNPWRMIPTGKDQFLVKAAETNLHFERGAGSALTGFTLTQDDVSTKFIPVTAQD